MQKLTPNFRFSQPEFDVHVTYFCPLGLRPLKHDVHPILCCLFSQTKRDFRNGIPLHENRKKYISYIVFFIFFHIF